MHWIESSGGFTTCKYNNVQVTAAANKGINPTNTYNAFKKGFFPVTYPNPQETPNSRLW